MGPQHRKEPHFGPTSDPCACLQHLRCRRTDLLVVSDWFVTTLTRTTRNASLGRRQSSENPGPTAERLLCLMCTPTTREDDQYLHVNTKEYYDNITHSRIRIYSIYIYSTCVYIYTYTYVCMPVYIYICKRYVCMYVCIMYVCVCMYMYIYICVYLYMYILIHGIYIFCANTNINK